MRPDEAVFSHKGRHEDPLPDDEVPLCFVVGEVPEVVPGHHHGPVLGGVVENVVVVMAGDDLTARLLSAGSEDQGTFIF